MPSQSLPSKNFSEIFSKFHINIFRICRFPKDIRQIFHPKAYHFRIFLRVSLDSASTYFEPKGFHYAFPRFFMTKPSISEFFTDFFLGFTSIYSSSRDFLQTFRTVSTAKPSIREVFCDFSGIYMHIFLIQRFSRDFSKIFHHKTSRFRIFSAFVWISNPKDLNSITGHNLSVDFVGIGHRKDLISIIG